MDRTSKIVDGFNNIFFLVAFVLNKNCNQKISVVGLLIE